MTTGGIIALIKALVGSGGGGSSLPTDPAQDGTYNLQNTVSSGTSTLSWASGSSSGGVLVVTPHVEEDGKTGDYEILDKTWQEIHDADYFVVKRNENGMLYYLAPGIVANIEGMGYVVMVAKYDGEGTTPYAYTAETANGYPVYSE